MRVLVSALALGAGQFALAQTRPHPYDLKDVKWEITMLPATMSIRGTVVNTIVPKAGTQTVSFDAVGMKVSKVLVDGRTTRFKSGPKTLSVTLPRKGNGKSAVRVTIDYATRPEAGLYFIPAERAFPAKTPVVYSQGEMEDNRNWIPTYDYPDDKATSEGIVHVPAGWSVLSNGRLVKRLKKGNLETWHWKMEQPHSTYLISVVAGPYSEIFERGAHVPVSYWVPKGLEAWGKAAFGDTARIVDFYGKLTGVPYPYPKYSQSAVPDFMFGGMENITATTQTIGALHPPAASPIRDETGLVAHELAHQWTGDLVTTSGWSDIWINEGWASFLPAFWTRKKDGQEAFDLARYDTFQGALSGHAGKPSRAMVDATYKDPIDMFDGLAYPGGASRMFMLMNLLGEDKFWAACKIYMQERGYTSFDTKAFFKTWSRATGRDLAGFMKTWFFTPGAPTLRVSLHGSTLVVEEPSKNFPLTLPVWILDGEEWIKREITLADGKARLDLGEHAGKPVLVDPEVWTMANIQSQVPLTHAQKLVLLKSAPNSASKARILDSMLGSPTNAERVELASVLSPRLLARTLGRLPGPEAKAFLIENAQSDNPFLQIEAIRMLGAFAEDPAVRTILDEAEKSTNPEIQFAVQDIRLRTKSEAASAYAEKLWRTPTYNDSARQRALRYWFSHAKDLARSRALEAIRKKYPEPTRQDAVRYLGSLKDLPGKREVYNTLLAIAKEPSFGTRSSAVSALAEYGDKAALPVLRPLTKNPLVFLRNTAQEAVSRLEGK